MITEKNFFRIQVVFSAFCLLILGGCKKKTTHSIPAADSLSKVVNSLGYEVIDTDREKKYVEIEEKDRAFYKPLSFECASIRSVKPLVNDGVPQRNRYFLSLEKYSTPEEAQKRADEYLDISRVVSVTYYDSHDISKRSVRCWGFASGERAYLLTTDAFMFYALEAKEKSVIEGVKAYEKQRKKAES